MELYLLRYFLAVVETGSFTKAASACLITQPTLSVGIRRLEDQMGVALFIRNLKRRTPLRPQQQASGGLADWCGECNKGEFPMAVYQRIVELPDGSDVPCTKCHPKHARARS